MKSKWSTKGESVLLFTQIIHSKAYKYDYYATKYKEPICWHTSLLKMIYNLIENLFNI